MKSRRCELSKRNMLGHIVVTVGTNELIIWHGGRVLEKIRYLYNSGNLELVNPYSSSSPSGPSRTSHAYREVRSINKPLSMMNIAIGAGKFSSVLPIIWAVNTNATPSAANILIELFGCVHM